MASSCGVGMKKELVVLLRTRIGSTEAKKKSLLFRIGPPSVPPNWCRLNSGRGKPWALLSTVLAAKTEFDPKLFVHADWMKALLDGDLPKLNQNRIRALVYANGIQTYMGLDPNDFDPTCAKRVDPSKNT